MKTRYEYVHFERIKATRDWLCRNNQSKAIIGYVTWYRQWKQYVFEGREGCVFSASCLRDVADFLDQLEKGGQ